MFTRVGVLGPNIQNVTRCASGQGIDSAGHNLAMMNVFNRTIRRMMIQGFNTKYLNVLKSNVQVSFSISVKFMQAEYNIIQSELDFL